MPTKKHTAHEREGDHRPPRAQAPLRNDRVQQEPSRVDHDTAGGPRGAVDAVAPERDESQVRQRVDGGATGAETAKESVDWESQARAEQAKAEDYLARWQRAAADMANMRRRHDQDRQEYVKQAAASLIHELLPVLDSFDLALGSIPEEFQGQSWVDGVTQIERQFRAVLERAGLQPIAAEGRPFDPNEHEALMQESSEQPEDTVIGELQRGYKLHDRVLRPTLVKVAKP